VSLRRWWGIGLLVGILNIVIWLGVGSGYWKMLGLY
jgi:DASS family divalent anion:Na+ symporter